MIRNPSTKILVTETERGSENVGGNNTISLNGGTSWPNWTAGGSQGAYAFRHPDLRMNVVFADGHAESVPFSAGAMHTRYFDPKY